MEEKGTWWEEFRDSAARGYEFYRCSCGHLMRDDEPIGKHHFCARSFTGPNGAGANQVYATEISIWEWILLKTDIKHYMTERLLK